MEQWFCVELRLNGRTTFMGRVKTTATSLREAVGPYADLNPDNGHCLVWGKPRLKEQ